MELLLQVRIAFISAALLCPALTSAAADPREITDLKKTVSIEMPGAGSVPIENLFYTRSTVGKTSEPWAAAVEQFGIIIWHSMLEHAAAQSQEYIKALPGDPIKDRAIYDSASPIECICNARAPLLVLQGENDIQVPKAEAEQVVKIPQDAGQAVEANDYPREGQAATSAKTKSTPSAGSSKGSSAISSSDRRPGSTARRQRCRLARETIDRRIAAGSTSRLATSIARSLRHRSTRK